MLSAAFLALFALFTLVSAAPPVQTRDDAVVKPLSLTAIDSIIPFAQFARAAYCPTRLDEWRCGPACNSLPDFELTLIGGDGNRVQYYFVGYWPAQESIVVVHEGTDPTQFLAVLTDVIILKTTLDPDLFPGVSTGIQVHAGFARAHSLTASGILAEVQRLMEERNTRNVITVGHSLGGALAELDSVFLGLNLGKSANVSAVTFGAPRVGDVKFTALVDSTVKSFKRVNNKKDVIPIVPRQILGFSQPKGEIHLLGSGVAVACPGDDDSFDAQCQVKSVPSVLLGSILDHLGPYQGVYIGTPFCR
ncbi:hypothetical protein GYMLUDRAFT_906741 [Collybiopsis luxurians FD-317 M1]|nr:hypothetical protein GYMLUDRAFT_906741 [Collybiopsis luxurians FD-317 M1]